MALENKFRMKLYVKDTLNKFIPTVTANDNTVFEFEIFDGAERVELLDTYRFIFVTKAIGKDSVMRDAVLNEEGLVEVVLGYSETKHAGTIDCALQIYDENDKRISTMRMQVNVKGDMALMGGLPAEDSTLVIADEAQLTRAVSAADEVEVSKTTFNTLSERLEYDKTELLTGIGETKHELESQWINVKYPPKPLVGLALDGVTDDYQAFQNIINNVPSGSTLFIPPNSVCLLTEGLIIENKNIRLVGGNTGFDRLQRGRITNLQHYPIRTSDCVLKFADKYSNKTMLTVRYTGSDTGSDRNLVPVVTIENLAFDGSDGEMKRHQETTGGEKDLTIQFTSTNCNGIDFTNCISATMKDCFIIGFSGFGYNLGVWNHAINCDSRLCGIGAIQLSDSHNMNPMAMYCKDAFHLGTDTRASNMARLTNIRAEWCENYGVKVNNGSDMTIEGRIDRCGYAGISTGTNVSGTNTTHWYLKINLNISRCGAKYRGKVLTDVTTTDYNQATNFFIRGVANSEINIASMRIHSDDIGSGIPSPVFGGYIASGDYIKAKIVGFDGYNSTTNPTVVRYALNNSRIDTEPTDTIIDPAGTSLLTVNKVDKTVNSNATIYSRGKTYFTKGLRLSSHATDDDTSGDMHQGDMIFNSAQQVAKVKHVSYGWMNQIPLFVRTAPPAISPTSVGMFYMDTTNKKMYVSIGTTNSNDWKEMFTWV